MKIKYWLIVLQEKKMHFVANHKYKINAVIDWFENKINSICIYVLSSPC